MLGVVETKSQNHPRPQNGIAMKSVPSSCAGLDQRRGASPLRKTLLSHLQESHPQLGWEALVLLQPVDVLSSPP